MIFYLTFPKYTAFRHFPEDVPLFVSRTALMESKRLPRARQRWALDSGGFMALTTHGKWLIDHRQYVKDVRRILRDMGRPPDWCAVLDWMTEPKVLKKVSETIGPSTVEDHQRRTTESYFQLRREGGPELEHLWLPVLQGDQVEDYVRHFQQYLVQGLDLRTVNMVGVGSVCRSWEDHRLVGIFTALNDLGLERLHGFGVKQTGLDYRALVRRPRAPGQPEEVQREIAEVYRLAREKGFPVEQVEAMLREHPELGGLTWEEEEVAVCSLLASADSAAWSLHARKLAQEVRAARDRAFEGRWKQRGQELVDPQTREVFGVIAHERAGFRPIDPFSPTQATALCSQEASGLVRPVFHKKGGESCSSCPRWALAYRERLRSVIEPLGCWETAPKAALPPPPLDVASRRLGHASHLAELWGAYGPGYFGSAEEMPEWARREARRRRGGQENPRLAWPYASLPPPEYSIEGRIA